MSKAKGYPANQPFNINARPNNKKDSWCKKSPYHNNSVKKVK